MKTMSKYVEDEKTGNWMLVDDDDQTGTEYDADEHLENLINRVNTWNHEDIRELKDVLDQIPEVLAEAGKAPRTADVIDYSDLPTEPIPAGVETYPVWAMDKKGRCLVGDNATGIEPIEDIIEWYEEKSQTVIFRYGEEEISCKVTWNQYKDPVIDFMDRQTGYTGKSDPGAAQGNWSHQDNESQEVIRSLIEAVYQWGTDEE